MVDQLPRPDSWVQRATGMLAQRAWFVDLNFPMAVLGKIHAAFDAKDFNFVDNVAGSYVIHTLKEIERQCKRGFPQRWPILSEAFIAHRKKKYVLSIPVILAQCDGICVELLGVKFFARSNGTPLTAARLPSISSDPFVLAVLEPLRVAGIITQNERELQANPSIGMLNRHTTLHGLSTDYGTQINSLRAISLLNFLCAALKGIQELEAIPQEQIERVKNVFKEFAAELTSRQEKKPGAESSSETVI